MKTLLNFNASNKFLDVRNRPPTALDVLVEGTIIDVKPVLYILFVAIMTRKNQVLFAGFNIPSRSIFSIYSRFIYFITRGHTAMVMVDTTVVV